MKPWTTSKQLSARLSPLSDKVSDSESRVRISEEQAFRFKSQLSEAKAQLEAQTQAREILQIVARRTQEQLAVHLGGVTTLAIGSVFPEEPYALRCDFVVRRGRTECDLTFERSGERFDPLSASGGGAVDVASFSLRVALWSLARTRPVLFLDEPFRFVSRNLQERCSLLLAEVSHRMGLQLIVVTHDPRLVECADRVFEVTRRGGVSVVEQTA